MSPPPPKGTAAYDAWASEDKGPAIVTFCWVFLALAFVFMACRMYVRLFLFRKLRSDDYWCLAGLVGYDDLQICNLIINLVTVLCIVVDIHDYGRS